MLHDEDFHRRAKIDRYGRRVDDNTGKQALQRLYAEEDEASSDDQQPSLTANPNAESGEEDEVVERELLRASRAQKARKSGHDPARHGGFSSSGSETDTSDEEEEYDSEQVDEDVEQAEAFGPQDHAPVPLGEITRRIAVVNLDWDNVRAVDLMVVASSFKPSEGDIERVSVYPSEFGRERMQREEVEGPPAEVFRSMQREPLEESSGEGSSSEVSNRANSRSLQATQERESAKDLDTTALRRYQLDRLRYYYAVVCCTTASVAKALYDNMDGREYLSSANFFDMRFVPDEVSFSEDEPRDECTKVPQGYRPTEFVTDALQHSKVRLTWDEDDKERKDVQKRAFGRSGMDVEANDMLAYVASASSEDDSEGEADVKETVNTRAKFGIDVPIEAEDRTTKPRSKTDRADALRAALGLPEKDLRKPRSLESGKPVGNLQITFTAGLSADKSDSVFVNAPEETTREKYLRKQRERKARRKARGKQGDGQDTSTAEPPAVQTAEANTAATDADDGFDDPFFDDPEFANRNAVKQARKAERQKQQQERRADEDSRASERAELELLMADENAQRGGRIQHFDMSEVAKLEKERKRKKKGKAGRGLLDEPAAGKDGDGALGFNVDVNDPRFAKVFESHDYAIDPNDPRYKGTGGMRALLEEGRRRRGKKRQLEEAVPDSHADEPSRKKPNERHNDQELNRLLHKVRSRSAKT